MEPTLSTFLRAECSIPLLERESNQSFGASEAVAMPVDQRSVRAACPAHRGCCQPTSPSAASLVVGRLNSA